LMRGCLKNAATAEVVVVPVEFMLFALTLLIFAEVIGRIFITIVAEDGRKPGFR